MKTIKAKNGEWVNLSNHLPTLTEVPSKTFALAISKNIGILRENLAHLEGVLSATPEFVELSEKVKVYEGKKDKKSVGALKKLETEYKDVISARQKQIDNVNLLLAEEIEIEIVPITEDMYPEVITAKQILGLTLLN
jgi:hypothetical protein|tara:strand:- start:2529 stop:2939 length:411 start_codon:yes stop_codon:yes gene_type:complete